MLHNNNVTLVGNIGSDTQVTQFENGNKVVRFNLATDNSFKSKDGNWQKDTQWHRVFAWGNIANFLENFGKKGKKVAIHGRLVTRSYYTKSGLEKKITEVEIKHILGL